MRASLCVFWLPKYGNAPAEYEDAFWPPGGASSELATIRVAVADGATETSFSGPWARLLTRSYCRGKLQPEALAAQIAKAKSRWLRYLRGKQLPWYAEEKLLAGASAAIVGAEINDDGKTWKAFAVGDCCLFHTRGQSLLAGFPLNKFDLFNNRPMLLSTVAENNAEVTRVPSQAQGSWIPQDTFYLMSDAVAAWFLDRSRYPLHEAINMLTSLKGQEAFAKFIAAERSTQLPDGRPALRNDDVTLIACTIM